MKKYDVEYMRRDDVGAMEIEADDFSFDAETLRFFRDKDCFAVFRTWVCVVEQS